MRALTARVCTLLGAALLPMAAHAADPIFRIESTEAAPGQTVNVRIFVRGGVADTAALNFTVEVPAEDVALIQGGTISGGKPSASTFSAYSDPDNNLTVGGALQYRGVLYAPTASTPSFSTVDEREVWNMSFTVSPSAPDGAIINLNVANRFDTDGVTGLVGLSNSTGTSIVADGQTPASARPKGENGTVTVRAFGLDVDFTPSNDTPSGWEFLQVLGPTDGLRGGNRATAGYEITLNSDNSFGFLQTSPSAPIVPGSGTVLLHNWTVSSTGVDPFDVPTFRLRTTANDASFTQEVVYQETQPAAGQVPPILVPTAGSGPKVFSSAAFVPANILDGEGTNGFGLAYDIVAFGTQAGGGPLNGKAGTINAVRRAQVTAVPVSSLTGETTVASLDFTGSNANGFTTLNAAGLIPDFPAPAAATANGLSIEPQRDLVSLSEFSYNFFENNNVFTVAADKIYRIDFRILSTANARENTNTVRMRLTSGAASKFTANIIVPSDGDNDSAPDADGETYTGFVVFPNELAGQAVKVSFDAYKVNNSDNGAVILSSFTAKAYDRP